MDLCRWVWRMSLKSFEQMKVASLPRRIFFFLLLEVFFFLSSAVSRNFLSYTFSKWRKIKNKCKIKLNQMKPIATLCHFLAHFFYAKCVFIFCKYWKLFDRKTKNTFAFWVLEQVTVKSNQTTYQRLKREKTHEPIESFFLHRLQGKPHMQFKLILAANIQFIHFDALLFLYLLLRKWSGELESIRCQPKIISNKFNTKSK